MNDDLKTVEVYVRVGYTMNVVVPRGATMEYIEKAAEEAYAWGADMVLEDHEFIWEDTMEVPDEDES